MLHDMERQIGFNCLKEAGDQWYHRFQPEERRNRVTHRFPNRRFGK
jgi:hypothetical protein